MKAGLTGLVVAMTAALALASAAVAGGNGTSVTRFAVTYPDGSAQCHGNRLVHDGQNAFIKDVETCTTTTVLIPAGTYDLAGFEWCSDFDGFDTCNEATSGSLTSIENVDGTGTWQIVAYYAQP